MAGFVIRRVGVVEEVPGPEIRLQRPEEGLALGDRERSIGHEVALPMAPRGIGEHEGFGRHDSGKIAPSKQEPARLAHDAGKVEPSDERRALEVRGVGEQRAVEVHGDGAGMCARRVAELRADEFRPSLE